MRETFKLRKSQIAYPSILIVQDNDVKVAPKKAQSITDSVRDTLAKELWRILRLIVITTRGYMSFRDQMPNDFRAVLDENEEPLWFGKPKFVPFVATGIPFLLLGLVWGGIDYLGFIQKEIHKNAGTLPLFQILFFSLHLFPFWGSILNMLRLFLVFGNTCYAFTNKRLLMRSGYLGIDFKSIDYDKIEDLSVTVNPLEKLLGVGTVRAFTGATNAKTGQQIYDKFMSIENPYEVFKRIKEVSVDVKTDWNYPNAIRPEENPGYHTNYRPKP